MDNAQAAQRGALARDREPVVLAAEPLERRLTEALAAAMAQEHEAVVGLDVRRIVRKLKRGDRPGVDARASEQGLSDERAVEASTGADDENARAA
jgi:hypothetical protein